jgi:hypothetical protein
MEIWRRVCYVFEHSLLHLGHVDRGISIHGKRPLLHKVPDGDGCAAGGKKLGGPDGQQKRLAVVGSVFLQHNFSRLDDNGDLVALLEPKLLRAAPRNYALNLALPNLDDNVRHDIAQCHFYNFSFKLVSCRYRHH